MDLFDFDVKSSTGDEGGISAGKKVDAMQSFGNGSITSDNNPGDDNKPVVNINSDLVVTHVSSVDVDSIDVDPEIIDVDYTETTGTSEHCNSSTNNAAVFSGTTDDISGMDNSIFADFKKYAQAFIHKSVKASAILLSKYQVNRLYNAALTLISKLPFEIKCIECTEESMSLDLFGLKVTMFLVNHGVPCYGYSFSLSRSGKCDPDKAKKNGVPPEIWTDLQHNKVIRMNGRVFTKDLIMGEARKGLKVTYTTDTRPCGNIVKFAKGSDLFICEGMYGSDDNLDNAVKNYHMTFSEAASLARDAHVEQMWLTHYSPGLVDPEKYISNATNIFKRTVCAYDTLSTVLEYQ